jgi:Zn-dependent peptidase ImmA (M78 family)
MEEILAVAPRSIENIELLADRVVSSFSMDVIEGLAHFDVVMFCESVLPDSHQVEFAVVPDAQVSSSSEGYFDGYKVCVPESVYRQACKDEGRSRFTLSHEASHGMLHVPEVRLWRRSPASVGWMRKGTSSYVRYRDPEWQANRLAGALLMPARPLLQIMKKYPPQFVYQDPRAITEVMNRFKVSRQCAEIRFEAIKGKEGRIESCLGLK